MPRILSDAEMAALEAAQPKRALSDEEMAQLEAQQAPKEESVWDRVTDPQRWQAIALGTGPKAPKVVGGTPPLAIPAAAAPKALNTLANFLNSSAPKRIAAGAVQGAATDSEDRLRGAGMGLVTSALGEGAAKILTKAGDASMQAAVGRKKFTPGVGTTLADEGIGGTHNMMRKQVASGLESRGQEIRELVDSMPEGVTIDSQKIGKRIAADSARPLVVPGAAPSSSDLPKLGLIKEFAEDVASRGSETPAQALQRRIAAGQRSYRGKENPLQSLLGNLSKQEQMHYSQALKDSYEASAPAMVPKAEGIGGTIKNVLGIADSDPQALAKADKAFGALKRAETGLEQPVSIPNSLFGLFTMGARALPGSSVGLSAVGQAATKAGQTLDATNPVLRQLLLEMAAQEEKK